MNPNEAIAKLSLALRMISEEQIDFEALRALTKEMLDQKHAQMVERGLQTYDKTLILHGLVGALSHYEAEKEKQRAALRLKPVDISN